MAQENHNLSRPFPWVAPVRCHLGESLHTRGGTANACRLKIGLAATSVDPAFLGWDLMRTNHEQ